MTENDRRENTSQVKPIGDLGPAFEPGRWYLRCVIQQRMRIGNQTWSRWVAAGLKTHRPGTKHELVFSDDLDRILRIPEQDLPPAYKSPYAEKNKARKKPRKE